MAPQTDVALLATLRREILALAKEPVPLDAADASRPYVTERISRITERILTHARKELQAEFTITSLRARYGSRGTFLRPLYTRPHELVSYFTDLEKYRKFDFSPRSFVGEGSVGPSTPEGAVRLHFYRLSNLGQEINLHGKEGFPQRIADFLDELGQQEKKTGADIYGGVDQLRAHGFCLAVGRSDPSGNPSDPTRFREFLALYGILPDDGILPDAEGANFLEILKRRSEYLSELFDILFEAVDAVEEQDRKDFYLQGLRIVSELIPKFTNEELSPAHKIGTLLEKLQSLFQRHLLGGVSEVAGARTSRPVASPAADTLEGASQSDDDGARSIPWVRFFNVEYRPDESEAGITPKFSVYPRAVARKAPLGAFLISHPRQPSTVKYLLHSYARDQGPVFSASFTQLFEGIDVSEQAFVRERGETPTPIQGIVLSADEHHDAWRRLNQDVSVLPTKSTTAFIISGAPERSSGRYPCGILAFESALPDAFSKEDIVFLTRLVNACAPLIQSLKLWNVGRDFRRSISEAFWTLTAKKIDGQNFGRFLFELLRMDGDLMSHIAESDSKNLDDLTGMSHGERKEYLIDPFPAFIIRTTDEKAREQTYEETIAERSRWLLANQDTLIKAWSGPVNRKVLQFLQNVPSNLMWYAYLSSIPRAIADREFEDEPGFSLFTPGFSALAVFIVLSREEIQQIVKLSSKEKIRKERERYRRHVRYKVPLAARLPIAGFAYETSGEVSSAGIEKSSDGYGALVSDLVGGSLDDKNSFSFQNRSQPFSLLDQCCAIIDSMRTHRVVKGQRTLLGAMRYHFRQNTILWQTERAGQSRRADPAGHNHWYSEGLPAGVRQISRVDVDEQTPFEEVSAKERMTRYLSQWDPNFQAALLRLMERLRFNVESKLRFPIGFGSAAEFVDSVDHIIYFPDPNRSSGFKIPVSSVVRKAIIHGDLSGRNLTWSSNYEKFFIIDFENVGEGFWGADQLKLLSSLVTELASNALGYYSPSGRLQSDAMPEIHRNVEACITLIHELSNELDPSYREQLIQLQRTRADDPLMVKLIKEILRTIDIDTSIKADQEFWRYALICFTYKQFEYALSELDPRCLDLINGVAQALETDGRLTNTFLVADGDNLSKSQVAKLVYSFSAFVASIPSA